MNNQKIFIKLDIKHAKMLEEIISKKGYITRTEWLRAIIRDEHKKLSEQDKI